MAGTTSRAAFHIEGWNEFIKGLRGSPDDLDVELRARFKEIAAGIRAAAAELAARQHPVAKNPRARNNRQHWGDLVATIREGATGKSPWVAVGSAKVPWAVGFEFGGGSKRTTRQFPPWRGKGEGAGYFLWPTVRARQPEIEGQAEQAVDVILKKLERVKLSAGLEALV